MEQMGSGVLYAVHGIATRHKMKEILEEAFSMRSVPRQYNEEQLRLWESLETAVWRAGVAVRQSPASKDVSTEAEEATALEAVTRQWLVKIQQTEET
jgi:hypothetical protein